jgi:hypothetical protein
MRSIITGSPSQIANHLLSEPMGQEALKAVNRFVSYNADWLQYALGVGGHLHETAPKITPWEDKTFKEASPYETNARVGM